MTLLSLSNAERGGDQVIAVKDWQVRRIVDLEWKGTQARRRLKAVSAAHGR